MPLELAGKLFLVLTFALIAGGTLWLNRVATGRWRLWPLLAFLLLYDRILLWGFLNYLFGLGLAICGLALWLALEDKPALVARAGFVSRRARLLLQPHRRLRGLCAGDRRRRAACPR